MLFGRRALAMVLRVAGYALAGDGAMRQRRRMGSFLDTYKESHQHRINHLCHAIGIPMIVMSLPVLFWSWKLAAALFVVGWVFQFIGHWFEGKPPAFFSDPRHLLVGPIWLVKKVFSRG